MGVVVALLIQEIPVINGQPGLDILCITGEAFDPTRTNLLSSRMGKKLASLYPALPVSGSFPVLNGMFMIYFERLNEVYIAAIYPNIHPNPLATESLFYSGNASFERSILESNGNNKASTIDHYEFRYGNNPYEGNHLLRELKTIIIDSVGGKSTINVTKIEIRKKFASLFPRIYDLLSINTSNSNTTRLTSTSLKYLSKSIRDKSFVEDSMLDLGFDLPEFPKKTSEDLYPTEFSIEFGSSFERNKDDYTVSTRIQNPSLLQPRLLPSTDSILVRETMGEIDPELLINHNSNPFASNSKASTATEKQLRYMGVENQSFNSGTDSPRKLEPPPSAFNSPNTNDLRIKVFSRGNQSPVGQVQAIDFDNIPTPSRGHSDSIRSLHNRIPSEGSFSSTNANFGNNRRHIDDTFSPMSSVRHSSRRVFASGSDATTQGLNFNLAKVDFDALMPDPNINEFPSENDQYSGIVSDFPDEFLVFPVVKAEQLTQVDLLRPRNDPLSTPRRRKQKGEKNTKNIMNLLVMETIDTLYRGTRLSKYCVVGEIGCVFGSVISDTSNIRFSLVLDNNSHIGEIAVNPLFIQYQKDTEIKNQNNHIYRFVIPGNLCSNVKHIVLLKYRMKEKHRIEPLRVSAEWRNTKNLMKMIFKYMINPNLSFPLKDVQILLTVQGASGKVSTEPPGMWNPIEQKLLWTIASISPKDSLRKILTDIETSTDSKPGIVAMKFTCDGGLISGIDPKLSLSNPTCNVVLNKMFRRFTAGKFYAAGQE